MNQSQQSLERVIISGGGTGGHIFPALAIAEAVKHRFPACEILFVGAKGRMEMERVPAAGYPIEGLDVQGFDRKHLLRNVSVVFKMIRAVRRAIAIARHFRPQVVVGVGGYASFAMLKAAQALHIPTIIQEQNSYAGVANKRLSKGATVICTAYPEMGRFFPAGRIHLTGNPIRHDLEHEPLPERIAARKFLGLSEGDYPLLVVVGGSLGARTLNMSLIGGIKRLLERGFGVVWQTGKGYFDQAKEVWTTLSEEERTRCVILPFIESMPHAYGAADLFVSRAGASTLSEITLLGIPSILVPSPNVAEDHQTFNAMALVKRGAAVIVKDSEAEAQLIDKAIELLNAPSERMRLSEQAKTLALGDAANKIVDIMLEKYHESC